MQIKFALPGLALAVAVAVAPVAVAAKPPKPPKPPNPAGTAITLDAKPSIIVFAGATTLSGRLNGAASGTPVRLEQDDSRPYGDSYKPTGSSATTANNGMYTFTVRPLLNTQYRVVAQTSPPVTSAARLVSVRMRVGLALSDSTPARGSLVRLSGSVSPAHDGRLVSIQRRSSTGSFITVVRTTLRDAGDTRSTYSRRVRVFRDGVYRVKVAADADHANGLSRLRSVTVHG